MRWTVPVPTLHFLAIASMPFLVRSKDLYSFFEPSGGDQVVCLVRVLVEKHLPADACCVPAKPPGSSL